MLFYPRMGGWNMGLKSANFDGIARQHSVRRCGIKAGKDAAVEGIFVNFCAVFVLNSERFVDVSIPNGLFRE